MDLIIVHFNCNFMHNSYSNTEQTRRLHTNRANAI